MIDKVFPKIHNEGYKFLVIFGLGTLVLYLISGFLGLIGVIPVSYTHLTLPTMIRV